MTSNPKMLNKKECQVLRRILGWHVGEKVKVKLKTKYKYGVIRSLGTAQPMPFYRGNEFFDAIAAGKKPKEHKPRGKKYEYAVVDFETKSPIPYRQQIPTKDLLEDDR